MQTIKLLINPNNLKQISTKQIDVSSLDDVIYVKRLENEWCDERKRRILHKNYYICHFCISVFPQSLSFICLCSVSLTILSLLHNAIGMFNHLNLLWPPNFQIKYLGAGRYFMEKKCVVTLAVGNNFNREKCSLKEALLSLPYKLHNPWTWPTSSAAVDWKANEREAGSLSPYSDNFCGAN